MNAAALRLIDTLSLLGMAAGLALMFQPWWANGLRVGFVATICSTLLQIATSHLERP